jgi:hypothetical protein
MVPVGGGRYQERVLMYENSKMRPVETIARMGGVRIKGE